MGKNLSHPRMARISKPIIWTLAIFIILVGLIYVYSIMPSASERLIKRVNQVQIGISESQLDDIMGRPADDVQTGNDYLHTYQRKTWKAGGRSVSFGLTDKKVVVILKANL
jgi:hypothetical protein